MHTCNFYGGLNLVDFYQYEFGRYRMLTVEKGEGLYTNEFTTTRDMEYTETKMVRACRVFKEIYGMNKTCYIYYNALLSWPWYKLHEDYMTLQGADTSIIPWSRNGDSTFPDSVGLSVFDKRLSQVRDFWTAHIDQTVHSLENQAYTDGIFVDRGFVNNNPEAYRTTSGSTRLSQIEYYDEYTAGKNLALNTLENNLNIRVVVNPGSYYYEDFTADYDSTASEEDVFRFRRYMESVSMVHLEKFCPDISSAFRLSSALLAGKQVQAHGGMISKCGNVWTCRGHYREYLAFFLMGVERNAKAYFSCHEHWSLNMDRGDLRDTNNDVRYEFLPYGEMDLPLGIPGPRLLASDYSTPVQFTSNTFSTPTIRPFFNRETLALQAVAVFNYGIDNLNTVCYVGDCQPNSNPLLGKTCEGNDLACAQILSTAQQIDPSLYEFTNAPTAGPPTAGPPTAGPPTAGPPTTGPPTTGPPTAGPPTAGPPTAGPPTAGPPTAGPPTAGPPTAGPPTAGPPTAGPPTAGPPTAGPPTAGPPTAGPPTAGPPTAGAHSEEASSNNFFGDLKGAFMDVPTAPLIAITTSVVLVSGLAGFIVSWCIWGHSSIFSSTSDNTPSVLSSF
jgi:hypothetical protein